MNCLIIIKTLCFHLLLASGCFNVYNIVIVMFLLADYLGIDESVRGECIFDAFLALVYFWGRFSVSIGTYSFL